MRVCSKCGIEKDDDEFYSRNKQCKMCRLMANRLWKIRNLSKHREHRRLCKLRHKEQNRRAKLAHKYINRKIKSGKLIKPIICENCKSVNAEIFGHHYDYNKPFDVKWLCMNCHFLEHNRNIYFHCNKEIA